jgi:hypothetical protein
MLSVTTTMSHLRLCHFAPFALALASSIVASKPLHAAGPKTAECLSAADKSLSLRNQHKLRDARTQLLICADASCPADIRKECIKRIEQVSASIPTIVFEAKDESGNDLSAVKVKMDDEVIAEQLDGNAIAIDPGAHTFVIDASGQPTVTRQLVIREGQKDRREEVQIKTQLSSAKAPADSPIHTSTVEPPPAAAPAAAPERNGLGAQKSAALVLAGVGVVGIGVGTVFGLQSMSKHNQANDVCPSACADQGGVQLWDDARASGNISTIGFVIGAAGLAGGAVLWLTAKPGDKTRLSAGVAPGSFQLQGTW